MQETDYSNTIFYKIYCKAPEIKEVYVGHTIDFVKRKQGHKQSCINERSMSHNLKVYKFIREHGGWDNWKMEIIGFKCCNNIGEACEEEQRYYDEYNATLNSVLPKKPIKTNILTEENFNKPCECCDIVCRSVTQYERHISSKTHKRNLNRMNNPRKSYDDNKTYKFICEKCDYKCVRESQYNRHLSTSKHKNRHKNTDESSIIDSDNKEHKEYKCKCGKIYKERSGLWRHKQNCKIQSYVGSVGDIETEVVPESDETVDKSIQNYTEQIDELKKLIMNQSKIHQQQLKLQQEQYDKQMKERQEQQNQQLQELLSKL